LQYRLVRLAGTSLLEAAFILRSLDNVKYIPGDWCEYGVAHGRTSALLAQTMFQHSGDRKLWLYDSFEGLPKPHEKDILLHDIFDKKSMQAYAGAISIPEQYLRNELASVNSDFSRFEIVKGWITLESLHNRSPQTISFAYLDMDFYQSTYDVLKFLIHRMPRGGIVVIDDYGFFSEGVRTAVAEILAENPGAFSFQHPFEDKFVILTRQ
jgi:O-methyltransferase